MAWFPFFMDVSAGDGLVVGGGRVALRKIRSLLDFGTRLTVCAPSLLPEIEGIPGLTLVIGDFVPSLLDDKLFVIAATNDHALNSEIAALCREKRIPVNVADDRTQCTFLFPALVRRGPLSVGVSTGGASPGGAAYWKRRIDKLIPEDAGDLLDYLDGLRGRIKTAVPEENRRAAIFSALLDRCMEGGWPLPEEELRQILNDEEGAP